MRITTPFIFLVALTVLAIAASPSAMAQQAGFHTGIAQSYFGFPPTQAPATVVRGGTWTVNPNFGAPPVIAVVVPSPQFVTPGQPFVVPSQAFLVPGQQFVVPGQQFVTLHQGFGPGFLPNPVVFPNHPIHAPNHVVVPNHVLVPGQTIVQPAPFVTGPTFVPAQTVPVIPTVQAPFAHFGPPVRMAPPAVGTPRTQVILEFGPPTVTIISNRGEILQFRGGVTVTIQNGQVISAR